MCVSVGRVRSCAVSHRRSSSGTVADCRFVTIGGRALAAMAPALTQATHQRQTLTLHPTSPLSMDTLTSVEQSHLKQLVWSSRCCGGGSGTVQSKHKEIARSEDVSRGDSQAKALDPPPTKSQALASTLLLHSPCLDADPAAAAAPIVCSGSSAETAATTAAAAVSRRCSVNGKAMGLQPTVTGDRMDLDSPLPAVIRGLRSDWPSPKRSSQDSSVPFASQQQATTTAATVIPAASSSDSDVVQDILDVINSMGVECDPSVQCSDGGGVTSVDDASTMEDMEALNKLTAAGQQLLLHDAADDDVVGDKGVAVEQKLAELRSKQQQVEQRCQSLLRRAGRLQTRHVSRHIADQVFNFVQYAKDTLGLKRDARSANGCGLYGWAEDGRLPTREEVRNIPTATLVNLVSRLQAPPISYLSNRRYFALSARSGQSASASACTGRNNNNQARPATARLNSEVGEVLEEVTGLWEAQLRHLQRHDDPDATESSSGGESDDDYPLFEQQQMPQQQQPTSQEPQQQQQQQQQQIDSTAPAPVKPVPT